MNKYNLELEPGYTPGNLRMLRDELNKTNNEFAELIGVPVETMKKWLFSLDSPAHTDMPQAKWRHAYKVFILEKEKNN